MKLLIWQLDNDYRKCNLWVGGRWTFFAPYLIEKVVDMRYDGVLWCTYMKCLSVSLITTYLACVLARIVCHSFLNTDWMGRELGEKHQVCCYCCSRLDDREQHIPFPHLVAARGDSVLLGSTCKCNFLEFPKYTSAAALTQELWKPLAGSRVDRVHVLSVG